MKYTAVIFDLDGTLLDTIDDLCESMNQVLSEFGFPTHPLHAYKYFVGDGMRTLVWRAFPEDHRDEEWIARGVEAMRSEYNRRIFNKTKPYDGIVELLDELTAKGIQMAILSNKPHQLTELIVQELLDKWPWAIIRGALPEVPVKPDPTGALQVAEQMKIKPEHILYVGDTSVDMLTAKRAGMFAVGVLWGFREVGELRDNGAEKIIVQPAELLQLID